MIIKNIYAVYFSPTGGTQKIAESLSNDLSQPLIEKLNATKKL